MNLEYRPDIDGLRAISIFVVVIYHAFPTWLPGGFVGVDVFFVISGFLITSIIAKEIRSSEFSFKNFYARRTKRIFPALLTVLFAVLAFGFISLTAKEYETLANHVLGGLFFSSNFVLWKEAGYFDSASQLKPLLHLWSLSIEEQFYIFWPPLLIWLVSKKMKIKHYVVLLLLGSFALNVGLIKNFQVSTFYLLPTRAWELLAGALLTFLLVSKGNLGGLKADEKNLLSNEHEIQAFGSDLGRLADGDYFDSRASFYSWLHLKGWLAPLLLIGAGFFLKPALLFPGGWAVIPVVAAFLFIGYGQNSWFNRRVASHPFAVWLGRISYPLYLWHWPIFSFARITTPELANSTSANNFIYIGLVLLSVALAELTYRWIENPFRLAIIKKPVRKLSFLAIAVAMLAGLVLLAHGHTPSNLSFDLAFTDKLYYFAGSTGLAAEECKKKYLNVVYCSIHDLKKEPTVLLIGDSLANQHFPGLSAYFAKQNQNLLEFATDASPGLYQVANDQFHDQRNNDKAFEFAVNTSSVRTVVLAFTDYTMAEHLLYRGEAGLALSQRSKINALELYAQSLRDSLVFLLKHQRKVVFILQNPPLVGFDHRQCVNMRPLRIVPFQPPKVCAALKAGILEKQAIYRKHTLAVLKEFPDVKVFDPMIYSCDAKLCYALRDGKLLYSHDEQHLSVEGSLWLSQFFDF